MKRNKDLKNILLKSIKNYQFKSWINAWRKFIFYSLIGCLFALMSCQVFQTPESLVRIGANQWPGYETLYLARNLNYYEKAPIQLIDYPSGTEEVRAYRNGEIEGAGISIDQALNLAATNSDVRIIAVMDFSNGGDVILAPPNISSMQMLKGKKIGVESTALGAFFLARALEESGMSVQDIEIVSLGLNEHENAYKKGGVDAVVTFGKPAANLLNDGAKVIFDSQQIPGEIVDVLIVRQQVIETQPQTIQALINARFKALDYLNQNPEDAAQRIAPRTGVTPEKFLSLLEGLESPDLASNQSLLSKTDPTLVETIEKLSKVMLEKRLISNPVDTELLLEDQFVKNAKF